MLGQTVMLAITDCDAGNQSGQTVSQWSDCDAGNQNQVTVYGPPVAIAAATGSKLHVICLCAVCQCADSVNRDREDHGAWDQTQLTKGSLW